MAVLLCGASAAPAGATTVRLGPPTIQSSSTYYECVFTCTMPSGEGISQEVAPPDVLLAAPAPGRITRWRMHGYLGNVSNTIQLVVLDRSGTTATARTLAPPATSIAGGANVVDIPVKAGQSLGLTLQRLGAQVRVMTIADGAGTASSIGFTPGWTAPGQTLTGASDVAAGVLQFNADLVLAPAVVSLDSATGPPQGGNQVAISGHSLDGATSVTFGGVPATGVVVDSPVRLRATAPPGVLGSTVDVVVTGPGGLSPPAEGARYTYAAPPPPPPAPPPPPPPAPLPPPPPPPSLLPPPAPPTTPVAALPSTPAPPATPAKALGSLTLPSSQRGIRIFAAAQIGSDRSTLRARLLYRASSRSKPVLYGSLFIPVARGLRSFTGRLNGIGRAALARKRVLKLQLVVTVTPPAGAVVTAKRRVTMRR